jgi:pimeloyl-ACP methyl ester carboxylesterase
LCAHAESGLAGLLLALEDPSCLSGLAAIGSSLQLPALARLRGRAAGWTFFTERLARRGFRDPQSAAAAMLDYADPAVLSRQEIRESARAWATLPGAQLRARVLNQTLSTDYRARINQALAAAGGRPFPVPLALLYGASDRRAPPHQAEQLNRMFPGSELHLAERSSGSVQVERPEWTARIVGALALACSPS